MSAKPLSDEKKDFIASAGINYLKLKSPSQNFVNFINKRSRKTKRRASRTIMNLQIIFFSCLLVTRING